MQNFKTFQEKILKILISGGRPQLILDRGTSPHPLAFDTHGDTRMCRISSRA